nr:hypothetical protein HmN_000436600 [Hymenolepis microstoma]
MKSKLRQLTYRLYLLYNLSRPNSLRYELKYKDLIQFSTKMHGLLIVSILLYTVLQVSLPVLAEDAEELREKMRTINESLNYLSSKTPREFCRTKVNSYRDECDRFCDSDADCEYECWSAWKYGQLLCRLSY